MTIDLALRLKSIKPSPTLEITAKAKAMKEKGLDVIGLGSGEPDFDTPKHIKQAGIKAIEAGHTKYTAVDGIIDLKEAIAKKTLEENNLLYKPEEIIVSSGAKQVIFNAFFATINKGDEVIIPAPYWVSYPDIALLSEGKPVIVKCDKENNFKLTPKALKEALTEKTKWITLNSPTNPTGMLYSKEEFRALGEVLLEYPKVMILCDDVYEYLIYDNKTFYTFAEAVPELKERTLVVNGVSKGCSMTGWRVGWGCGPQEIIAGMKKIQSQSTSNVNTPAQYAALEALTTDKEYLKSWVQTFADRRDVMVQELQNCEGIECMKPQGAFYAYPSCERVIGKKTPKGDIIASDQDFCRYLLDTQEVAVVPGSAFGLGPYFRASYATSLDNIKKACSRIRLACSSLRD